MWRLPARESRCRTCSPEEASGGAVPFQDANLARVGKRAMSPTATSSRAAPDGPMPVSAGEAAAGRGEQFVELFVGGLLAQVDPLEVTDQLHGDPQRALPAASRGRTVASSLVAWAAGQVLLRTTRNEFQQQDMQPARSCACGPRRARGAGRAESVAACVAHHQRPDATHWCRCRPARPSAHPRRLAALPADEYPGPGRKFRRYLYNRFAISDQAHPNMAAGAIRSLHRPPATGDQATAWHRSASPDTRPRRWPTARRRAPSRRCSSPRSQLSACADPSQSPRCLLSRQLPARHRHGRERGGQRFFEHGKPLLSLSPLNEATPGPRRPNESHTLSRGQPK